MRKKLWTYLIAWNRRTGCRIFNKMVAFIRQIDIRYKCFYIELAANKGRVPEDVSAADNRFMTERSL